MFDLKTFNVLGRITTLRGCTWEMNLSVKLCQLPDRPAVGDCKGPPRRRTNDVNHPIRSGIRAILESLIELPFARHFATWTNSRAIGLRRRDKCKRETALVVVDKAREYNVNMVRFKQAMDIFCRKCLWRQKPTAT
jgi:hypothetical protein